MTSFRIKTGGFLFALLISCQPLQAQHHEHTIPVQSVKSIYLRMMDTMMIRMAKAPTGNRPATAFLYQMIPHHQGAVAMAQYEIANGQNREMIQLAKSILIEQKSELEQMQRWLKQAQPDSTSLPSPVQAAMNQTMAVMMSSLPPNSVLTDIDHAFAAVMKPHHQAAIDMVKVLLRYSDNGPVNAYARQIMATQQIEIDQMSDFLK